MTNPAGVLDRDTGTLPFPPDLYERHEAVINEFGMCVGCGHDALFPCHRDIGVLATLRE